MGKCVSYEDKDGTYNKVFTCYEGSLQDLTFAHYDLDLEDNNIVSIFDPIEPSGLSLYRQSKDSFHIVY